MGKYSWSVNVAGYNGKEKNMNHLKNIYRFIIGKSYMFKNKKLEIKNHGELIAVMTYEEVVERNKSNLTEVQERGRLLKKWRENDFQKGAAREGE